MTTHWVSDSEASRSLLNESSATLTIVLSSTGMIIPAISTAPTSSTRRSSLPPCSVSLLVIGCSREGSVPTGRPRLDRCAVSREPMSTGGR